MRKSNIFRLFITGILCIILVVAIVPRSKTIWELSQRKNELEKEKACLEQINREKQMQLDKLDSPEAIERIAREQLGMVKEGERVIMQVIPQK
ncbi:MAG: septum formation initiator family protein [Bacillota bacterium]|nr:septum formation initiator family protein [Bacillota bacterium]